MEEAEIFLHHFGESLGVFKIMRVNLLHNSYVLFVFHEKDVDA